MREEDRNPRCSRKHVNLPKKPPFGEKLDDALDDLWAELEAIRAFTSTENAVQVEMLATRSTPTLDFRAT